MSKVEKAVSCFEQGFLCSQAVLSTFSTDLGLDKETALKVSGAFGGGMARMGEVCGAVTGAYMVIGLKYSSTRAEDSGFREKTYQLVKLFNDDFSSRNGSIKCKELLGCDISTSEGLQRARDQKLFSSVCPNLIRDAANLLEKIL
ncbi:C-GCAxxG-C-C family protein [Desulforamulus aquiferis]|uniref:C-GCAxxG-C-C family protein n=1 Tax=Desulforamulus aquiferis TaxID=1397668 RepID=A0AAW7ZE97_9FIRM|nr:C-GCAxxG-C-C family protein [Desulforamulus aquiferis]MDO7788089.1 C-GCAxxG-C-C family protein [Desulforamulus aquiferis]